MEIAVLSNNWKPPDRVYGDTELKTTVKNVYNLCVFESRVGEDTAFRRVHGL
jgi:hypothetical protein